MATILWRSPQAVIEIATAITVSSSTALNTTMSAKSDEEQYEGMVKDLSIRGGERDVETIKLLGYNEILDQKRATIVECTFTTAYQGTVTTLGGTKGTEYDFAEWMMGQKQTVTGTYDRSIGGEKASNDRAAAAVLIKLADGTNNIHLLLNNAYCTSRELSLGSDGHVEQTVTFKCLASNYYEEDDYA